MITRACEQNQKYRKWHHAGWSRISTQISFTGRHCQPRLQRQTPQALKNYSADSSNLTDYRLLECLCESHTERAPRPEFIKYSEMLAAKTSPVQKRAKGVHRHFSKCTQTASKYLETMLGIVSPGETHIKTAVRHRSHPLDGHREETESNKRWRRRAEARARCCWRRTALTQPWEMLG